MHEVLVNRLGGLSLPRKSVVRLTDRPDMTLDVYRGRKTTMQQQQQQLIKIYILNKFLYFFPLKLIKCDKSHHFMKKNLKYFTSNYGIMTDIEIKLCEQSCRKEKVGGA